MQPGEKKIQNHFQKKSPTITHSPPPPSTMLLRTPSRTFLLRLAPRQHRPSRRLLSTDPPSISSSTTSSPAAASRSLRVGQLLILVAVATPVAYTAYKWNDPEFQAFVSRISWGTLGKAAPVSKPASAALVVASSAKSAEKAANVIEPPTPVAAAPVVVPPAAAAAAAGGEDWASIKAEIDELEERYYQAQPPHVEKFKPDVVKAVLKQIETVEKKTNENAAAEGEAPSASDSRADAKEEDAPKTKDIPPPADREAVDRLRAQARAVSEQASAKARSEVEKTEAALRADLEKVLAHDLGSLDEQGLRERLVQLVLELKDRNKWEALRMHEFITKANEELGAKYMSMLREQERLYEEVVRQGIIFFALDSNVA